MRIGLRKIGVMIEFDIVVSDLNPLILPVVTLIRQEDFNVGTYNN